MSKYTQKEIFTVHGHITIVEDRHRFIPNSPKYLQDNLEKVIPGKKISCMFSEHVPTRSEAQLAYHWVLIGYLATHLGYTKDELHDAVMRSKFGTKTVMLNGEEYDVRRSVADKALFPKGDMVELINYDLELCANYEVAVPTAEELGYIKS